MQLQLKTVLASLAIFSLGVLAAPTDGHQSDLQRRVLNPLITFKGDLADYPAPDPADKNYAKKVKENSIRQPERVKRQQAAEAVAKDLLRAAQRLLPIPDGIAVDVINDFHPSKLEKIPHVTLTFDLPGTCAPGKSCLGHAFDPKDPAAAGRPGEVFNGAGVRIFP
ncbi:hypothetical protein ONZ45_g17281 [Pleurotus djamor]|nr:hypothetical protein ONZ45_g17281 [Pleurotus djamor]